MNTPTLNTRRLILRKFNENDLEAFYDIFSDKEVNQFLTWFPLKNLDEAKSFYQERYASIYQKEQGYAYAICLKKEYWHQEIVSEAVNPLFNKLKKKSLII